MKKRFLAALISLFVVVQCSTAFVSAAQDANSPNAPDLKAESAVLIEQKSGKVLFEKDADKKMYPASTTKNLTALLGLENLNLDEMVTVGSEVNLTTLDSSAAGLKPGEKISVRNLIYALMLPSGNDAAYTIAVQVARKKSGNSAMTVPVAVKYFVDMMNKKLQEIGAKNSNFTNPDGYHDPNHYTTAKDMAVISREAMKNDFFREVVKTREYSIKDTGTNDPKFHKQVIPWVNKNELINQRGKYFYQYATGIKTGHTSDAGNCLTAAASRDGMNVIAVVLKDVVEQDRWEDAKALLDYGLSNFKMQTVLQKGQVVGNIKVGKKYSGKEVDLQVVSDKEYSDIMRSSDFANIKQTIEWNKELLDAGKAAKGETRLLGPVNKDQVVGKVTYSLNGKPLVEANLLATQTVMQKTFLDKVLGIFGWLYKVKLFVLGVLVLAIAAGIILRRKSGRNRRGSFGRYMD